MKIPICLPWGGFMKLVKVLLCLVYLIVVSFSSPREDYQNRTLILNNHSNSFLPPNNLHKDLNQATNNMTRDEFFGVIERVSAVYCPIIEEKYEGSCEFEGDWESDLVNAFAMRYPKRWIINVFGGLARRPELTVDGLTAVVCHEVGHHFGGFTFKRSVIGDGWPSTEGQSDYFAAHECMPRLWKNDKDINASFGSKVDLPAKQKCDEVWDTQDRRNLCYRVVMAAKSDTEMIAGSKIGVPKPTFLNTDLARVDNVFDGHPNPQCRLDTQFSAALCKVKFNDEYIPGSDIEEGNMSLESEIKSMETTCHQGAGIVEGSRPLCWFKPRIELDGVKMREIKISELSGNSNGIFEPGETGKLTIGLDAGKSDSSSLSHSLASKTKGVRVLGQIGEHSYRIESNSTLKCGQNATYFLDVNSNVGNQRFYVETPLGKVIKKKTGIQKEFVEIGGKETRVFKINYKKNHPVERVKLYLSAEHKWVSNLHVKLITPNGKKLDVQLLDTDGPKMKKEFLLDHRTESSVGNWGIEIRNSSEYLKGEINEWSIDFEYGDCD
jgi:hypothetical protein